MATRAKAKTEDVVLLWQQDLPADKETPGTVRYAAESPLSGRNRQLYVERVDFKMLELDPSATIRVTVEAIYG